MFRIIRTLPRIFIASESGFEDASKSLLAEKLVVVHILDDLQQMPDPWLYLAQHPELNQGWEQAREMVAPSAADGETGATTTFGNGT